MKPGSQLTALALAFALTTPVVTQAPVRHWVFRRQSTFHIVW